MNYESRPTLFSHGVGPVPQNVSFRSVESSDVPLLAGGWRNARVGAFRAFESNALGGGGTGFCRFPRSRRNRYLFFTPSHGAADIYTS